MSVWVPVYSAQNNEVVFRETQAATLPQWVETYPTREAAEAAAAVTRSAGVEARLLAQMIDNTALTSHWKRDVRI